MEVAGMMKGKDIRRVDHNTAVRVGIDDMLRRGCDETGLGWGSGLVEFSVLS